MLELKVQDGDREVVLSFEHSLLSLSKWESKHKKPFLATPTKTSLEMVDYYQDMLTTPDESPNLVYRLSPEQLDALTNYINESRTASSVPQDGTPKNNNVEIVTSELIYYWLSALKIPFQPTETWHLTRLMILVQIANYKAQPAKKRNPGEMLKDWREMNARNKEKFGTTG